MVNSNNDGFFPVLCRRPCLSKSPLTLMGHIRLMRVSRATMFIVAGFQSNDVGMKRPLKTVVQLSLTCPDLKEEEPVL